jgi:hypothetical protein
MVSFDIDLFSLISICSFGGLPYARNKWTAIRSVGSIPHLPSNLIPTLSQEGSTSVGLTLTFGPRARLKTPLTILRKSYNSRQTSLPSRPIVLNGQSGRLNLTREVLHGGNCAPGGNDSHLGCYFLSSKAERGQTEVRSCLSVPRHTCARDRRTTTHLGLRVAIRQCANARPDP